MINEFSIVKPGKFDHLHLVSHSTVPLSGNPTKWSNTLKQFVGSRRLKGLMLNVKS